MTLLKGLRASSAEKWVNCPASAIVEQGFADVSRVCADEGILAHEIAEWCLKENQPPEVKARPAMARHIRAYIDYVSKASLGHELYVECMVPLVPFGIDSVGKIDALCVSPRHLHVIDFKYGRVPVALDNNYQLYMYAYGALKSFVFKNLTGITLSIIQPRLGQTILVDIPMGEFNNYISVIKMAVERVRNKDMTYNPGRHCMFCRAKKHCFAAITGSARPFEDESEEKQ